MTVIGTVQDGKIILPAGVSLPEGSEVTVSVLAPATKPEMTRNQENDRQTFHEGLMKFAGIVKDMPPDYSVNHDHYLYGTPKTSP